MINSLRQMFFGARNSFKYRNLKRSNLPYDFPESPEKLKISELFNQWWYYSIELMPGMVTRGGFQADLPMLPRIMLRRCELRGMSCLDLGSMEGLIPVLMCRGGASLVLATDGVDHCVEKIAAVKHYYNNEFDYRNVGLMYDLYQKLEGSSFDLINCSGLLYHVFSPLTILSGIRPLLKRNGFMIVTTNVIFEDSFSMEFNDAGRMQADTDTYWYPSVKLLDYMLRYLKLAPLDCIYLSHKTIRSNVRCIFNKPSGYISVLCCAADDVLPTEDDKWMVKSTKASLEYSRLSNWQMAKHQPISRIKYKNRIDKQHFRQNVKCLDLWEAVKQGKPIISAEREIDSHLLRLSDNS